jgi:hypothetical protein
MVKHFLCVLLLSATVVAEGQTGYTQWNTPSAGNPFVPGYFADPTIRKFGDTYYLYATTDGTGNGYGPAQVWVSYDFRNWKNIVMNWPTTEVVWAPDVVQQPDGTYRYFYCEPCVISIGQSTSPIGPWNNILGREDAIMVPDRYVHNAITLDPQLFRDDDGSEYLYFTTWGIYKGFGCGVAKLNKAVANSQFSILNSQFHDARFWNENDPFPIAADTFFSEKKLIPNDELKDIFEAPYVFKRNGIYYFTYSSGSCHDDTYRVQYAISKTGPMGPFEYKGCILKTNGDGSIHGPGHHSVLVEDGRYYIVYHRHNLPRSVHGFNRQIAIDEMKFDANGDILPVEPTHGAPLATEKGTVNLAYQAKVTASSYYDEWFRPEYAVDDNNATLWKASATNWGQNGGRHHDEWLQIDLGSKQRFNEIWTQFEYATFFYQYKVETSVDGQTWTLFADRMQSTMQGSPMIDRGNVKARYIRITIADTQKNGHMPAIWNVKVWKQAPLLPPDPTETNDAYPGMHKKDVSPLQRTAAVIGFDMSHEAKQRQAPFDVTELNGFKANKPIHARVKDGRWALFFNGSQRLTSNAPLPQEFCYNAPYTISAWLLQTEGGAVATVASLSPSHADLATTEFRLGSDPRTGLICHNGSFESYGAPEAIQKAIGSWHQWTVTFDGWMERVYLDGQLIHEQNNFMMVRPDGPVSIGADGSGANNFRGYISSLNIMPYALSAADIRSSYEVQSSEQFKVQSLGDEPFDESDPDSRFTLPTTMKPVVQQSSLHLSAKGGSFNDHPWEDGAQQLKEIEGDFVIMATIADMEGLQQHAVKGYNEVGILVSIPSPQQGGTMEESVFYQLGAFPLYNCGNMFTILSRHGRPQYPNYRGYEFDRIIQFERRGNKLFARTSRDGQTWNNMPGSPVDVTSPKLAVGVYQTTYNDNTSWGELRDIVIYN